MSILNDVVHFRGEIVTLYATFKLVTAEATEEELTPFSPRVKVEYATPLNVIVDILPWTPMQRMTTERWFHNWIVPQNAPFTVYNVVYSGVVLDEEIKSTEELVIGNPALTTAQNYLRYGPKTVLQRSRTYEPRQSPQLPKGTF